MNVLFFGLGRIGLPQSLVFADAGHQVFGFDSDAAVVDRLLQGAVPFEEPGMPELLGVHLGPSFKEEVDHFRLSHALDLIVGLVPALTTTAARSVPSAKTRSVSPDYAWNFTWRIFNEIDDDYCLQSLRSRKTSATLEGERLG